MMLRVEKYESTTPAATLCGDGYGRARDIWGVKQPSNRPARWFLREWMQQRGKRQADIFRELGWDRGRTSKVVNGKQPYTSEDIGALAEWLRIEPHELLMSPADALMLKRLRETAAQIVANLEAARG